MVAAQRSALLAACPWSCSSLVRVAVGTGVLRRDLRGGGVHRRRSEGKDTPFHRVSPSSQKPPTGKMFGNSFPWKYQKIR